VKVSWQAPESDGGSVIEDYIVVSYPEGRVVWMIQERVNEVWKSIDTFMSKTGSRVFGLFSRADLDHSGDISLEEFTATLKPVIEKARRMVRKECGEEREDIDLLLERAFKEIDADSSGSISLWELKEKISSLHSHDHSGNGSTHGSSIISGSTELSVVMTGLRPSSSYTFVVRAVNDVDVSPNSAPCAPVTWRPKKDAFDADKDGTLLPLPHEPLGVSATCVIKSGSNVVSVEWKPPGNATATNVVSYMVEAQPGGLHLAVDAFKTTVCRCEFGVGHNLQFGVGYTFSVTARNAAGEAGPPSAPSNEVTPVGPPSAPLNVAVEHVSGSSDKSSVRVSWQPPKSTGGSPIEGYIVVSYPEGRILTTGVIKKKKKKLKKPRKNKSKTSPYGPGFPLSHEPVTCSVVMMDLDQSKSYTFTVRAMNSVGEGSDSSPCNPLIWAHDGPPSGLRRSMKDLRKKMHLPPMPLTMAFSSSRSDTTHLDQPILTTEQALVIWNKMHKFMFAQDPFHMHSGSGSAQWVTMNVPISPTVLPELMRLMQEPVGQPVEPVKPWMPVAPPLSPTNHVGPKVLDQEEELRRIEKDVNDRLGGRCPHIEVDLTNRRIHLQETINFWAGTADIKPECFSIVEQLQIACRMINTVVTEEGMPPLHMRVEGHVHKTNNIKKCWRLSDERAAVIVDKIGDAGYPRSVLHPKGFGPSRPLGTPKTDRRVEVHVMDQAEMLQWGLLPGAPQDVAINVDDGGTAVVTFKAPTVDPLVHTMDISEALISANEIQKYSVGVWRSKLHRQVSSPGTVQAVSIPGLRKGHAYHIEVAASSTHGMGKSAHLPMIRWNGSEIDRMGQLLHEERVKPDQKQKRALETSQLVDKARPNRFGVRTGAESVVHQAPDQLSAIRAGLGSFMSARQEENEAEAARIAQLAVEEEIIRHADLQPLLSPSISSARHLTEAEVEAQEQREAEENILRDAEALAVATDRRQ